MLRRMSARPPSRSFRCARIAPAAARPRAPPPDAGGVEHPRRRRIDLRRHRRLHAARQHQHAPRMALLANQRASASRARAPWPASVSGSSGRTTWPSCSAGANSGGQALLQRPAHQGALVAGRSTRIHQPAADLGQLAVVLHARRAGGLAVAAGQAAVEVGLQFARRCFAFEQVLDLVDARALSSSSPSGW